jgi:cobalt/nickel transport system ATP-binding protein
MGLVASPFRVIDVSANLAIQVCDLSFAYPDGATALADISFTVAAGERIGLIGPNGAGKTSLFLCLSGVLKPRAVRLQVGSLDVRDPGERRRLPTQVGIVFQNSDDQLFNATIFDDVAFGPLNLELPPDEVRKLVAEALERVGLTGMEERVPFHLSGGEKRRVALAGVLAMRPSILLLDEPSMYLDPRGRRELIQLLHTLGGTRMIAAHDLELILQTCDRVLLLDRGRLIADGAARTILADAALMEAHGLEVPYSLRDTSLAAPKATDIK